MARNALKWGCGGINIDAIRIDLAQIEDTQKLHSPSGGVRGFNKDFWGGSEDRPVGAGWDCVKGRWPANLILSHLPECSMIGTHQVKTGTAGPGANGFRTEYVGGGRKTIGFGGGYADSNGEETVASWLCHPGCPIAALDEQSGIVPTGAWNRQTDTAHPFGNAKGSPYKTWQESPKEAPSGASRYFKVV